MHPIAFQFGSLTVTWYGVMVAMGFVAGLWTASRRGMRVGVPAEKILDIGPWLILGSILGARILYIISYWHEQFAGRPVYELFMIWRGGLVFYGGLIGASLACLLYCRLKSFPVWKMADIMAPSIPLGSAFGRIGCLLNGCCYGSACNLPWAIHYPEGHQTYPFAVHPTQVYDSLLNFSLYIALAFLLRRKRFDGQIFAVFLVGYAIIRAFAETFRGDYPQHYLGGWATPAQVLSIGILLTGIVLLVLLRRFAPPQGAGVEEKG